MSDLAALDLVSIAEISYRLGIPRGTVLGWRHRMLLPPAEARVEAAPLWRWETIVKWCEETGRHVPSK